MSPTTIRRIEDATPRPARGRWIGAVCALSTAAAIVWWLDLLAFDRGFRPALLVALAPAILGVVQAVRAIGAELAARRFGASAFEVEGGHVDPGGELRGRVFTTRDLHPTAGFRMRLRCFESVRVASAAGSSQGRDEERVAFEIEDVVTDVASSAREGIPVRFQIPQQSARTSTAGRGARWALDVAADVEGAHYAAVFGVPVASRGA